MTTYVTGPVRVTVPATSANLGPGFDALGLALSLRDELTAEIVDSGLLVEVSGEGADQVPRGESHLVVRAMRAAFAWLGEQPPGLRLTCTNRIPHSRGLGSSSAAIVAGVSLARALATDGAGSMDDAAAFRLCAELEGHPDNVAPALYGGLVISGQEDGAFFAVPVAVDPRLSAVVLVPPTPVATAVARGLLPATVPHADAAANAGRAALLVAALSGRPEHLLAATRDRLHQDYREDAMPESLALVRALRADGVPAVISGAGPTVLALCAGSECGSVPIEELLGRAPAGWLGRRLAVETRGAVVG